MPKVNPDVLIWARETAGLTLEEAAKKLGLSGPERLEALEKGTRDPSRPQLVTMAEKYRRPLLTFYLPTPPPARDRGQDFRTLPQGFAPDSEAVLDSLIRDVQARQRLVLAALEDAEEDEPLSFVASVRVADGVDAVVKSMRDVLQFNIEEFRMQKTVSEAFARLRASVERAGVYVLLMGNLGTHHTDIDVRVFRGFSLADKVAPFVVINEKDSRAAWSFTLLHELAHIWLGQTGISGYDGEVEIERFCDLVAAEFLLPKNELRLINLPRNARLDEIKERIDVFAGPRNLSRKMVAYNLLRSNFLTPAIYRDLRDAFDAERVAQKKEQAKGEGGPDYYIVRRHRIGPGLVHLVERMLSGGVLTTTKAGKVLGVKPTAVDRLISGNRAA